MLPNLERIGGFWEAQDELMSWALAVVDQSPQLSDHFDSFDLYLDAIDFSRQNGLPSDRHTALFGLFIRTFDSSLHGIRAAVSGNYAGCTMYARDLLETNFLIDFLMEEPGRPEAWLKSSAAELKKHYHPAVIRKELDNRDGFTGKRRKESYDLLSQLGVHPTPQGMTMRLDDQGKLTSFPFKNTELLSAVIEELAKVIMVLSTKLNVYLSEVPDTGYYQSLLLIRSQKSKALYFSS